MLKIGLLSDTHGFMPAALNDFFKDCDEIWHAGDWGAFETTAGVLEATGKKIRGVYGNIDGQKIRIIYPEKLVFEAAGLKVAMIHIGGYPGKYAPGVKAWLQSEQPGLFICGHSHILKIMRDPHLNQMLHINPGAAGNSGFHKMRTAVRFNIENGRVIQPEVIEMGGRAFEEPVL